MGALGLEFLLMRTLFSNLLCLRAVAAFLSVLILVSTGSGCATGRNFNSEKSIEMTEGPMGTTYSQSGEELNPDSMIDGLKRISHSEGAPEEVQDEAALAQSWRNTSTVFSALGGALIGVPLGTGLTGQSPNWTLAYFGIGLATTGFLFAVIADRHVQASVKKYNETRDQKTKPRPVSSWLSPFDLHSTPAIQAGLRYSF
jgi:hypothetical protein